MADLGEYRSTLQRIMIIATLGGLLFGYDTGVVNGALPFMAAPDQLNLDPLQEGMVVSSLLVALNGLASVIDTSTGIYLMKTMPRRRMLTTGFCGTTFSLLMIAILATVMANNPNFGNYFA